MSTLATEFQTYQRQLSALLTQHNGQYVVIKGAELRHFSESYEQALDWAYEAFGLDSFFVKKVCSDEGVAHFTRDLGPCRS
jgi:hypothetical protein